MKVFSFAFGAAVIHSGLPGVVSHRADHKSVAATAVINRADLVAGAAGIDRIAAISDEVIVVPRHDQHASISEAANICPPRGSVQLNWGEPVSADCLCSLRLFESVEHDGGAVIVVAKVHMNTGAHQVRPR